ncbi:aminodeoxychorismate/anthranilate synthase component II [Acinetobacter baumannii]|uniref:anthranilate synthase component II n=1 Tax=Acinetobacter baumannii TaxID=470 RepID=UPI002446DA1F|nr:aminodeoxychorismate/anthranilate synthase component II [Acinetobacter baumannii]MDH2566685.1 aminodeoxychorismate/anthranilate synthase component II [Acinetobacter baumannii]
MHLMIDNYDSFTYNVYQYCKMLDIDITVVRNDQISLEDIQEIKPESIIISPGPCSPKEAGISVEVIKHFGHDIPIFGICLGHQCISEAFGGEVIQSTDIFHGKSSPIIFDECPLFKGFSKQIEVGRYHSLVVSNLPDEIIPTSWVYHEEGRRGEIMALRHKDNPIFGVQFHPESILTENGIRFFENYFRIVNQYNEYKLL